ncbi:MAG: hypothetical protein DRI36_06285, partial [Caldiserica bacterium]
GVLFSNSEINLKENNIWWKGFFFLRDLKGVIKDPFEKLILEYYWQPRFKNAVRNVEKGNYEEAIDDLYFSYYIYPDKRDKVKIAVKDVEDKLIKIYYRKGMEYGKDGEIDRAIHFFKKALKIKEKDFIYEGLGISYFKKRDYEKARRMFLKAVKINPLNPKYYNYIGSVSAKENRFKEALFYFKKALEISPDYKKAELNYRETLKRLREK